jgi:hypothetical protein
MVGCFGQRQGGREMRYEIPLEKKRRTASIGGVAEKRM